MKTKLLFKLTALLMLCGVMLTCDKEEKPGSIFGLVTDFSTSEPVGGANVQLRPSGETTLTGTDGMYEFSKVSPGSYSIRVSKAEYTDLIDEMIIEVKDGGRVRRDVQIKKRPASLHLYDNGNHEITELDFGTDAGVIQKTFNVFNGGTQDINYSISKTANWISNIDKIKGTIKVGETCPIVVSIDRELLAAGDNTTVILITSSSDGGKELTIKATKSGESPTVSILEALAIDSTTYRIKCEVVSGGGQTVTERGICWNTFGDPMMDDETIKYSSGGLGQYAIRMEHLSLSTHYYVRAYAKNAMGIGFSEVLDFRTGAAVLPPSVSTVEVDELAATTAVCIGNVSSDGGSDLTECGVCWSKNANPTVAGHHQAASEAVLGVYSVNLTGLTPNTTYHVRCYATNAKGTAYGEDLTFTTTEGLPVVTTSGVTDVTATSAKGGGEVTDEGASAVTERGLCWSKNHNPTTGDSHSNSGTGVGSFTVNMTGLTPNGTYYVRAYAKNHQGTSYGAEVSFTALEGLPTVVTQEVDNITATTAKGHGKVTYQGGSAVTERGICWSTEPSPTVSGSHAHSGTGDGEFEISITGLNPGTTYYVRAYAKNTQGLTYGENKTFTTGANLPVVTTSTPTSVTQTTAQGGGDVTDDGGATVTERGICWSTSHNPTTDDSHVSSGTGMGTFTVEMTGLAPGTKYYVRAYAINTKGTAYGNEVSVTTAANKPTVTTAEVSNITQTTAQGGGNVTDDGGASVTERGVCWSTSHDPTTSGSHLSSGTGTGSFTCNITGLTANTKYYIRAYAINSQGTSYGSELSFTTSLNVSSPTVTTSQVTDITETTATGGGNVTNDGNATVTERGICWSTSQNPTTSGSHASSGSGTGTFTVNMTGLTSDTKYYVRSYAKNSEGTSYGSEVSFTTLKTVTAPTVTTTEVTNITQTTATGGGNVTSSGNATVTARGICWSTSHNPTVSNSHTTNGTGTGSFTGSMTGLTANTTYYVRAYATNSAGTAYGSEVSFTTSQNVTVPTVTTSSVTNITQTTATGGGNVTSSGNATVTARGICWSTSHNPTISNSHTTNGTGTGSFTGSMTGLTANTTYYVRAYATNSAGTAYGSEVSFTTSQNVTVPTVTTSQVTNITQTTATGGGNVTSSGNATVTARGICWSTSHNPTVSNSHTTNGTGTGSFTGSMTGLTANTTYYVRAYATNSAGTAYGSEVSFTTSQNVTVPTVTTSSVTNITQTTATGGGNVTSSGNATVTARGICWSTSHNPTVSNSHTTNGTGTGSFTGSMTGLTANTTYYVRAYATNSAGTAYGSEVSFTTSQNVTVPTVTTSSVTNITQTTATGGGNVTSSGNATVTARGICWSTSHNPTVSNSHTTNGTGTGSFTGSMTGLTANTTYYVRAYATNSAGTAYGSEVSFTTTTPQAPTGAINGLFSVSATQQVYFSQGNLQYRASTNTWRFADNQYDYVGSTNSNISSSYSGWIDLFGWGTSGYNHGANCYQPWSTSPSNSAYYAYGSYTYNLYDQTGKADWGYNPISNGGNATNTWRTLTKGEWVYVFNTRATTSGIRYAKAQVNNVNGVILLPDNWSSSYYSLSNTNNGSTSFTSNVISSSQWDILEQHGAVFLPAAGYRDWTSVNNVGSRGYYWSASYISEVSAYRVWFDSSDLDPQGYTYRSRGNSVRLVRSVQ